MKTPLILALSAALLLVCASTGFAQADEADGNHNAGRKLGRGFANLLFGIVEVPNQINSTCKAHGGAAAATVGVGKGIGKFLWRELVGVYEIVTFPVPVPGSYKPVVQPEFPTEDFDP